MASRCPPRPPSSPIADIHEAVLAALDGRAEVDTDGTSIFLLKEALSMILERPVQLSEVRAVLRDLIANGCVAPGADLDCFKPLYGF